MEIDMSTDSGARATRHLEDDQIAWLKAVGPDGTPQHPGQADLAA